MGCGSTPHRTSYSLPVFFPPPPTGVSSSSAREARQEVEVQRGDGCTYPKWPSSKLGRLGVSCLEGARVLLIHALIEHRMGHQPWASGLYPLRAHLQVGKTISSPPRSLNMAVTLRCLTCRSKGEIMSCFVRTKDSAGLDFNLVMVFVGTLEL